MAQAKRTPRKPAKSAHRAKPVPRKRPPVVGLIMGSTSDWETMQHAAAILEELAVPFESKVVSAHRTPNRLYTYAKSAARRGLKVIIAGAGGAAHLPGM
ncbi:MAG: AIR carboxylase family protein, partial [Rhodobacteraceae bacterium]|nr:AIR carboxylase family protein [Paracoccaceae bacterium]